MSIPGLLIEYLISGAVALLWMFPYLQGEVSTFGKEIIAIIVLPILYVLGMFIDSIAYILTKYPKLWIRKKIEKKYIGSTLKYEPGQSFQKHIRLALNNNELNKEIQMRSSRDRIARGMIVNSIFLLLSFNNFSFYFELTLLLFSCIMWYNFEYSSYGFLLKALDEIDAKGKS